MRILHVHSGNIFGGVERILIALAGHHRISPAFQHSFALCFRGELENELLRLEAPVFVLPEVRLRNPRQLLRARARLRKLLRNSRFDVAVAHSAWTHLAFASVVREGELPLAFWLHTAASGHSFLERAAQIYFPDRIISVSHAVDQTAKRLFPGIPSGVAHAPMTIDPGAFDPADREAIREALGATPGNVVILQASRLERWKGHIPLLRALQKIADNSAWTCWIAGGAERPDELAYLDELQKVAEEPSLAGRVQFLGARKDVPRLMQGADIYCQANLEGEGFSIAFLEACLAGLPIVTSALGGAAEIVDARTGILLPPGYIDALAASLEKLIADQSLRRELGASARRKALERCDPARQFAALEDIFFQTVATHG